MLKLGADKNIISFGGGYPDPALFPSAGLCEAFTTSIEEDGAVALQYSGTAGLLKLREQIAARMARDNVQCTADNILVVQGAQQGLDLVARMLIDTDDTIVTEDPTFLGALIAFNPCLPRYAAVRVDADGMDMDALEETLKANPQAKLLYTVPDFHNPTGVTMSLERRKRLVELANQYDLIVLEDSPYREIRFEGEAIPSVKSFDTEGRVIYLGSFSKILAPSLRLGWVVASEELIGHLSLLKLAADTQCSTLAMTAVTKFLEKESIDAHIKQLRSAYLNKRDVMIGAIERYFPTEILYTRPTGGMFTWLSLPDGFDATKFLLETAVPHGKVAYVPGATFFATRQQLNHARLSYSTQPDEQTEKGIRILGELFKANLRSGRAA